MRFVLLKKPDFVIVERFGSFRGEDWRYCVSLEDINWNVVAYRMDQFVEVQYPRKFREHSGIFYLRDIAYVDAKMHIDSVEWARKIAAENNIDVLDITRMDGRLKGATEMLRIFR